MADTQNNFPNKDNTAEPLYLYIFNFISGIASKINKIHTQNSTKEFMKALLPFWVL